MSKERGTSPEVLAVLTDKEYEMVLLINSTNEREICGENVPFRRKCQTICQTDYSKLQIEGVPEQRGKQLLQLLEENS